MIPNMRIVPTKAIIKNSSIPNVAAVIKSIKALDTVKDGESILSGSFMFLT